MAKLDLKAAYQEFLAARDACRNARADNLSEEEIGRLDRTASEKWRIFDEGMCEDVFAIAERKGWLDSVQGAPEWVRRRDIGGFGIYHRNADGTCGGKIGTVLADRVDPAEDAGALKEARLIAAAPTLWKLAAAVLASLDPRTGREVSDVTRNEMAPIRLLASKAAGIVAGAIPSEGIEDPEPTEPTRIVRVIVACEHSPSGKSGFSYARVEVSEKQYAAGAHYAAAKKKAEDLGFTGCLVAVGEDDGYSFLFDALNWRYIDVVRPREEIEG